MTKPAVDALASLGSRATRHKRQVWVSILLILCSCNRVEATAEPDPPLVDTYEAFLDLGEATEGEHLEFAVPITLRSDSNLEGLTLGFSCGCTSASLTAVGDAKDRTIRRSITGRVDTSGRIGPQETSVWLTQPGLNGDTELVALVRMTYSVLMSAAISFEPDVLHMPEDIAVARGSLVLRSAGDAYVDPLLVGSWVGDRGTSVHVVDLVSSTLIEGGWYQHRFTVEATRDSAAPATSDVADSVYCDVSVDGSSLGAWVSVSAASRPAFDGLGRFARYSQAEEGVVIPLGRANTDAPFLASLELILPEDGGVCIMAVRAAEEADRPIQFEATLNLPAHLSSQDLFGAKLVVRSGDAVPTEHFVLPADRE
jgi:hypothetical protein